MCVVLSKRICILRVRQITYSKAAILTLIGAMYIVRFYSVSFAVVNIFVIIT